VPGKSIKLAFKKSNSSSFAGDLFFTGHAFPLVAALSNIKFNGVGELRTHLASHVRFPVNHGGTSSCRNLGRFRIVRGPGLACRFICATWKVGRVRATGRLGRNGKCADQWYSVRSGKCWWDE
jgi:hypothetical protein